LKTQTSRVLQHLQNRQAVLARPREISRVIRIAKNMRVPEPAGHPRRGVVRLLIRGRCQARQHQVVEVLLERLRAGQNVRDASGRNLHLKVLQQFLDLGFTGTAGILQGNNEGPQI